MDIKIEKLKLNYFKGIKELELNFVGSCAIHGDNATGKTTVFDAVTWLLFDKDSAGRADFGIKTLDAAGQPMHNAEHTVSAVLNVDGQQIELKKVYKEKWVRKRGAAESEFTGHETLYYVNDVPCKKSEYTAKIGQIISEDIFKMITNPLYFNNMKWQDRRALLLTICGSVDDEQILASSEEFEPIKNDLQGRSIDEYKKMVASKQTEINKELKLIPVKIAEAEKAMPEVVENIGDKTAIEEQLHLLDDELKSIASDNGQAEKQKQLQQLENEKAMINAAAIDTAGYDKLIQEAQMIIGDLKIEKVKYENEIKSLETEKAVQEQKIKKLRDEWYAENEKQFINDGVCHYCGQPLPEEQLKDAEDNFNINKSNALEKITMAGQECKEKLETINARIENEKNWTNEIEIGFSNANAIFSENVQKKEAHILSVKREKEKKVLDIEKVIETLKNENNSVTDDARKNAILEQQKQLKTAIADIEKAISQNEMVKKQQERIFDLAAEEKMLAIKYSEWENKMYLVEQLIRKKVDIITYSINSKFEYAKFKLFDIQINGGLQECCEVTFYGVPYSDLNNAAKINIGLDIINTICKHYGTTAPIFIDNAESVSNIWATGSQQIKLVVDANYNKLEMA